MVAKLQGDKSADYQRLNLPRNLEFNKLWKPFCVPSEPEITEFNGNSEWNFHRSGRSEQILTGINGN